MRKIIDFYKLLVINCYKKLNVWKIISSNSSLVIFFFPWCCTGSLKCKVQPRGFKIVHNV